MLIDRDTRPPAAVEIIRELERDNAWLRGRLRLAESLLRTAGEVVPELAGAVKALGAGDHFPCARATGPNSAHFR